MKAIRRGCAVPLLAAAALTIPRVAWAGPGEGSFRSGSSGDWSNAATWEIHDAATGWRVATVDDGVPGMDDRAGIQAGHVVTVSGEAEIGKLVIERGNGFPQDGVREGILAPAESPTAACWK